MPDSIAPIPRDEARALLASLGFTPRVPHHTLTVAEMAALKDYHASLVAQGLRCDVGGLYVGLWRLAEPSAPDPR